MLAVIHRNTPPSGAGALPLAGPPVVIRQLQWLHNLGCERVAIELGQDEQGEQVRRLVSEQKVLSRGVVFICPVTLLRLSAFVVGPGRAPTTSLIRASREATAAAASMVG